MRRSTSSSSYQLSCDLQRCTRFELDPLSVMLADASRPSEERVAHCALLAAGRHVHLARHRACARPHLRLREAMWSQLGDETAHSSYAVTSCREWIHAPQERRGSAWPGRSRAANVSLSTAS